MRTHPHSIARCLASAFVRGRWELDELLVRGTDALGKRWRWLRPLVLRLLARAPPGAARPSRARVVRWLLNDEAFQRACGHSALSAAGIQRKRPLMLPAAPIPASWNVTPLTTTGELAEWLNLRPIQLDCLADQHALERTRPPGPLRRYRYYWLAKRLSGSARLIESPRPRLKAIQRQLLRGILDNIPSHPAAHGFRRGGSIQAFVAPHVGQPILLRTDLRDFFASIGKARVAAIFRTAGYPEEVAWLLAALCTNRVPSHVWPSFPQYGDGRDRLRHERLYTWPHLPQGAPTSPAIANLCAYRLDCRLAGLARAAGGQYTRYADDLLFSGPPSLARSIRRFYPLVLAIVAEEGFNLNGRKTRIMRPGGRQQAAGLVLNAHANVPRDAYDRLKATLHNCVRHGPASQNRAGLASFQSHLDGRVAFVESVNPQRGLRLRALFDRINF